MITFYDLITKNNQFLAQWFYHLIFFFLSQITVYFPYRFWVVKITATVSWAMASKFGSQSPVGKPAVWISHSGLSHTCSTYWKTRKVINAQYQQFQTNSAFFSFPLDFISIRNQYSVSLIPPLSLVPSP